MNPDLELVQVRRDQSFKIWSHGYPYRTVRWHFHPEYELHLVTATEGTRYVGDHISRFSVGDLVLVGPNVPHNWISNIDPGQIVEERCLVLQFSEEFIAGCIATFPELRFLKSLMKESVCGASFDAGVSARVEPLLREMLRAEGGRRIGLFIEIFEILGQENARVPLGSSGFRLEPSFYLSSSMNAVLKHIGRNFKRELKEEDMARLGGQSISAFSRSFRKHTGLTFVQYVNAMRIELTCQHLTLDDLTITEICFEVGFNNVSNFNRQFLSVKGLAPSKFRDLYRKRVGLAAA